MNEVRMLATCVLGLGFSAGGLKAGLELEPDVIACDAGSSDFGPFFLGSGKVQKSRLSLKRDMALLIEGARALDVPFMTGSVGGAGGEPHLAETVDLVQEIGREKKLGFKLAAISATLSKDLLKRKLREGKLHAVGAVEPLDEDAIDNLTATVGMMGSEPFSRALDMGAQVIVAGRATDPAIFASVPLRAGIPPDVAWHASKTLDKGYLATTRPQDGSPVLGRLRQDHFTVEPTRSDSACTVATVAGITLHENPDPYRVTQPTGVIDTSGATYDAIDDRTVRVSGSRYEPAPPTIKIEGVEYVGHRHLLITGLRDPRLIERLDEFLDAYRSRLDRAGASLGFAPEDWSVRFRVYGRDAVMGAYELHREPAHELGLIVDVIGRTQEISGAMGTRLGSTGSRFDITDGRLGGGGNFAYPFSPSLINVGPVYRWRAWHVMDVDEPELVDLFPIQMIEV